MTPFSPADPRPAGQAHALAHDSTGFGHGKVILLGEHAVVYGKPALAAGLSVGVRAQARDGSGRVRIPSWKLDLCLTDSNDHPVTRALAAIARALDAEDADLDIEADLPAAAGLGSSAALATAAARALGAHAARRGRPSANEATIARAIALAEKVFHDTPSGIDAAAAQDGGVGLYVRGTGWQPVSVQPFDLCIGLSRQSRQTRTHIEAVARLVTRTPAAGHLLDALGAFTEAALVALKRGDLDELGRLFNLAHGVLAGLGVSTLALEGLVFGARAAGALGAKLTGAGGGGAVIALAPGHEQDVLSRWRADGFEGFVAHIGSPDSAKLLP